MLEPLSLGEIADMELIKKIWGTIKYVVITLVICATIAVTPNALMFQFRLYQKEQRWNEMFAKTEAERILSVNRLCDTILKASKDQDWKEVREQWSDLCFRNNTEYQKHQKESR